MADETDAHVLARYRERHGNPYMNLTTARALNALHLRYRHLSTAAQQRARRDREVELERIRRKIFGLDTVASPSAVDGLRKMGVCRSRRFNCFLCRSRTKTDPETSMSMFSDSS